MLCAARMDHVLFASGQAGAETCFVKCLLGWSTDWLTITFCKSHAVLFYLVLSDLFCYWILSACHCRINCAEVPWPLDVHWQSRPGHWRGQIHLRWPDLAFALMWLCAAPQPCVTTSDLARFLVEYAQSDLLGQIANAHLATADESPLVRAPDLAARLLMHCPVATARFPACPVGLLRSSLWKLVLVLVVQPK